MAGPDGAPPPARRARRNPGLRRKAPPADVSTGGGAASREAEGSRPQGAQEGQLDGRPEGPTPLTALPPEICLDILRFLAPEDLASCSKACSFLRAAADDDRLWRRAYCLRWGRRQEEREGTGARPWTWKQAYFRRDAADAEEFLKGVSEDLRPYYAQMHTTRRSTAPNFKQACAVSLREEKTLSDEIADWRKSHNFAVPGGAFVEEKGGGPLSETWAQCSNRDAEPSGGGDRGVHGCLKSGEQGEGLQGGPSRESGHVCSGQQCTFHQIGDVFLCEKTGQAHVCGSGCSAAVVDSKTELLVCAVSGRCFDRIVDEEGEEDLAEEGGGLQACHEDDVARLGAAFVLGYDCEDEDALLCVQRSLGAA